MSKYVTAKQLQNYFTALPSRVQKGLKVELNDVADRLVAMQKAALQRQLTPPDDSGGLDRSIRKEPGAHDMQLVVRAGGPLTTRDGYDYALAIEFGTQKQRARSFFYGPFRIMKRHMRYAVENAVTNIVKSPDGNEARVGTP